MNSVGLNNLSLKYQRFMTLGCKDLGIRKSEFVAKTQFLFWYFTPFSKYTMRENKTYKHLDKFFSWSVGGGLIKIIYFL